MLDESNMSSNELPPDAIAIVGMACRLPGAASPAELWELVRDGREAISNFTDDELQLSCEPEELISNPDYVRARGIIEDGECFDAEFFGIQPGEARLLDPQQRLFLECAWAALEDAGYDPLRAPGAVGVFGGVGINSYARNNLSGRLDTIESGMGYQQRLAVEKDYVATRVAYKLNLKGPALTVQTACSTSLVATVLAVQSLQNFTCDIALAGGSSIFSPQRSGYLFEEGLILSPDGHCRPFDVDAQGVVPGNGTSVVVLRRLEDALADGDPIYAVIRGAAFNNDGSDKVGYTAPSVAGQAEVIATAQALADVDPATIGLIEAHGTATAMGDPIEVAALTRAFRHGTDRKQYCALGSVKGNIGHTDTAAGVAGLMKAALALHHRQLPPSLHYKAPGLEIGLESSPFYVNTSLKKWETDGIPRRAGVSAFGLGGTNAHVVLEEAPLRSASGPSRPYQLICASARTDTAAHRAVERLADFARTDTDLQRADFSYTLHLGRKLFAHRRFAIAAADDSLDDVLRDPGAVINGIAPPEGVRVAFMFAGGGAQHPGMGFDLYESEPVYRAVVDEGLEILRTQEALDLRSVLFPEDPDVVVAEMERPSVGLPALFITQMALARLLERWGIIPDAVIGHSVGEYAAACISGVIEFEDALRLVALRGRLFEALPEGGMLSIALAEDQLRGYLSNDLEIAAVNSTELCVVSGPTGPLSDLEARLASHDVDTARVKIAVAAHSSMVDEMLEPYRQFVGGLKLRPPRVPFASNLSGTWLTAEEAVSPEHWAQHVRKTVRFDDGLKMVFEEPNRVLIEVGPGRTLSNLARQHTARTSAQPVLSTMRHPHESSNDQEILLNALGQAWSLGAEVDWQAYYEKEDRCRISLPTYPFERVRHWIDPLPQSSAKELAEVDRPLDAPVTTIEASRNAPVDRSSKILSEVRDLLSMLSGVAPAALDLQATFLALGFDSLSLTQASQAIKKRFGVRVSFRSLLEETKTIAALAEHLDKIVDPDKFVEQPAPTSPAVAGPPIIEATSQVSTGETTLLERTIVQQLQLMQQQLEMLRSGATTATDPPQPVSTSAPEADAPKALFKTINKKGGEGLTRHQQRALDAMLSRYTSKTAGSKRMMQESRAFHSDPRSAAAYRQLWKEAVYPLTADRAEGSKIWDVDGNAYIDFNMGFGVNLLGHSPKFVVEALQEQLATGFALGPMPTKAKEAAERVSRMTGHERVAFFNTGSEAMLAAIRAARATTGRSRIVMFEHAYHGNFDEVLMRLRAGDGASVPRVPGVPWGAGTDIILLPYGNPDALEVIRGLADDLAAVLVEPVQSRHPDFLPVEFLRNLRELCSELDAALIFDEMITGFRCHPGGVQAMIDIRPDMAAYGKVVGGGMPVGVIAGSARFMDCFDGGFWQFGDDSAPEADLTYFAGTHRRHPLAIAAVCALLEHLENEGPALQEKLNRRTEDLAQRMTAVFETAGLPVRIVHFGSLFRFDGLDQLDYGDLLYIGLRSRGIFTWEGRNNFVTTAHTDDDLDQLVRALGETVVELIEGGLFPSFDSTLSGDSLPMVEDVVLKQVPPGALPLTEAQREMWSAANLSEEASCSFNEVNALRLTGQVDLDALKTAVRGLVDRHEALRITFSPTGEYQTISAETLVVVEFVDLCDEVDKEQMIESHLIREAETPFDLVHGPLMRAAVLRLGPDAHVFVHTYHHLVYDGWSLDVLNRDLAALYNAARAGEFPVLDAPIPYGRFVASRVRDMESEEYHEAETYWREAFSTIPDPLELPTDRPRTGRRSNRAGQVIKTFRAGLMEDLLQMASEKDATLFTTLLSALFVYLHRITGQDDLVVGIISAGQQMFDEGDELVGHGADLLPLRARIDSEQPVADVLRAVRNVVLDGLDHRGYTFGTLVKNIGVARDPGRVPLVEVSFNLDRVAPTPRWDGLDVGSVRVGKRRVHFDLEINVDQYDDRLEMVCAFNADLLDEATVARWMDHIEVVLSGMVGGTEQAIHEIPIMTEEERQLVLQTWNETERDACLDEHVHQIIEAAAVANHSRTAIVSGDTILTYAQLDARANQIAHALIGLGVREGTNVGLYARRSHDLPVALLGILKAGAAYVPLDPAFPADRVTYMIDDADLAAIVTESDLVPSLAQEQRPTLLLDSSEIGRHPTTSPDVKLTRDACAYVLYTSGSTGRPKGVMVEHCNVVNFFAAMDRCIEHDPPGVWLALTSISFDISVLELLWTLARGFTVVVARDDAGTVSDGAPPPAVAELISRHDVSHLQCTPSQASVLAGDAHTLIALAKLQHLLVGGEALPEALAAGLLKGGIRRLTNMYGPTETTIWSSTLEASSTDGHGTVPIGRPVANTYFYVLDGNLRPTPIGVPGELWIGGEGVTRGYHKQPELTAERFVDDVFREGGRMYRTGDRVRYRADGIVEYLGRTDHQVKLRGFRIELGEIEARLVEHPSISEAAVVVREDTPGHQRLVAYYTTGAGRTAPDLEDLRTFLGQRLPAYMVPAAYVAMERLPMTPNQKVDRNALPTPSADRPALRMDYAEPRTEQEKTLAEIVAKALGIDRVGVHDNLFEIGVDSMLVFQISARANEAALPLEPRLFFWHQTVAKLARSLTTEQPESVDLAADLRERVAAMSAAEVRAMLEEKRLGTSSGDSDIVPHGDEM